MQQHNIFETVLDIASIAWLYKSMTHKNLFASDNVRNGGIGAIMGAYAIPRLEKVLKDDPTLSREHKDSIKASMTGALGGALLGYLYKTSLGDYVRNNKP